MILNRLILAPVTVQKWEWLCPEHGPCQGRNAPFGRRGQGWADPYSTDEFAIKFKDFFRGRRGANRSKIRRDFGGDDRAPQECRREDFRLQSRPATTRFRGFSDDLRNPQAGNPGQGGPTRTPIARIWRGTGLP